MELLFYVVVNDWVDMGTYNTYKEAVEVAEAFIMEFFSRGWKIEIYEGFGERYERLYCEWRP